MNTCDGGTFVETQSAIVMGIEGYILHNINLDAWIKLVCSVYLMKHKTFNSEPISSLYASLMATSLADGKVQLLKWLAYDIVVPFTDWHDFTIVFTIALEVKIMNVC